MSDFWEKYRQRAKIEGHIGTWLYLLGNFVLPKLKIQIKYLFFNVQAPKANLDSSVELALLDDFSQLDERDLNNLQAFEGASLIESFKQEFSQGNRCVISRKNGLASACWIAKAPEFLQDDRNVTYLIRDCFTLPAMRGQGLYPMILNFAIESMRDESPNKKTRFAVNSIFTNRSSIRGIVKSGFNRIGLIFQFGSKGFVLFNNDGKRVLRFL